MEFSKYNDVNIVLKKAEKSLKSIEEEYNKALYDQNVSDELLADIKDYLGNLKSPLDYLSKKIGKSNFPIRKTEADFDGLKFNFSDEIRGIIKKWQPFNANEWFLLFNILNNKSKHWTLIPQIRKETKEFSIKKDDAGVTVRGCSFSGNIRFGIGDKLVSIDEATQFPVDTEGVDIERKIWIDFLFDNSQFPDFPSSISALPFLKQCFDKITKIVSEIEKEIIS